jgi:2-oxoglutarate dehydrogenase E1 component
LGKVYYDPLVERESRGIEGVYLLRVEQLYPVPLKALTGVLSRFQNAEVVWCQEEPKNIGGWSFIEPCLEWILGRVNGTARRARYVSRPAAASPAVGTMAKHQAQLTAFLEQAFAR